MNPKLRKTIVAFYISLIIHGILFLIFSLVIALMFIVPELSPVAEFGSYLYLTIYAGLIIVLLIIAIKGLKKNKYSAWILGLIICGLQFANLLTTLFSIIAAIGLLQKETRNAFKIKEKKKTKLIF